MFKEAIFAYLISKLIGRERTKKLDKWLKKYTKKLPSIIFVLIAIVHTVRFPVGFDIVIAGWLVPLWFSALIVILFVYLSYRVSDLKD